MFAKKRKKRFDFLFQRSFFLFFFKKNCIFYEFLSISSKVLPSLFFRATQPFIGIPVIIDAQVDGEVKR